LGGKRDTAEKKSKKQKNPIPKKEKKVRARDYGTVKAKKAEMRKERKKTGLAQREKGIGPGRKKKRAPGARGDMNAVKKRKRKGRGEILTKTPT